MFGIGGFELFLILLFGFLVFGPDKLPEIAKTVGRAIAKFRDTQAEVTSTLQNVAFDKNSDQPFKNPFDSADKVKVTARRGAATAKDVANSVKASVQNAGAEAGAAVSGATQASGAPEGAAQATAVEGTEPARESFSERKARYERERKAKAQTEQAAGVAQDGSSERAADSADAQADSAVKGGE